MIREIVKIDEEKCDGCGECVPSCHEGAIAIMDGVARLSSDQLCDGLGDCLGHCPQGAITIERREAVEYDEELVRANLAAEAAAAARRNTGMRQPAPAHAHAHGGGGCPGSRQMNFERAAEPAMASGNGRPTPSELTHWPVQIALLPPNAPALRGSRLLVAADCVPFAYPDFHAKLLRGRTVMVGCPKLDNNEAYVEKFTEVIRQSALQEIVVARMEVPCCTGILMAVLEARQRAGVDVKISEVVIGVQGGAAPEREVPALSA